MGKRPLTSGFADGVTASRVGARVAVRGLRSVAGPAVAIELSNVAVSDRNQLVEMAEPVATAVVHSITATRPSGGQSGIPGTR